MFCQDAEKWLYRLDRDYTWNCGMPIEEEMSFKDQKGTVRMVIKTNGDITVTERYSWDGCTPKFCFLDVLLGIPDGAVHSGSGEHAGRPKAYHASLVHDVLYQFLKSNLPYSRKDADRFFLELMKETGFKLRWVYYIAVRIFGGVATLFSVNFGKKRAKSVQDS